MASPLKVGVIISGGGSNLQALIDAAAAPDLPAEIGLVISNNAGAYGLERARKAGIATKVIDHRTYPDRESFDRDLTVALEKAGVELVCLAGFLRVLTDEFVNHWRDRMINIHPSLLPKYKGLHTHKRAIEAGEEYHGCTVHYVRPDLDTGPLLLQARVPVLEGDTPEILAGRVLEKEHLIYPEALRKIALGEITVEGETPMVNGHPGPVLID
ncbi:phosphoribosylglycinamide formyltransferase [Aestuariispira insulae]|uniref:Phosphoribosylglycinamide formyltransferase n=1 Tax=Aestuariispira insulae TaxID=1461337 RepID=A0A3D9HN07_9PROT|nr:phosphoribosylglycinamide formyltransferase [Aestuariispira insulae]RED50874.1 phosphoribosylglycinamide formyltransferase-1 [Aestuariispira insulae]